jgi:hypothetical protein
MKKVLFAVLFLAGLWAVSAIASERAANAYKATKLTSTSVLISCQDEREPTVSKLENTATAIVVTCKQ